MTLLLFFIAFTSFLLIALNLLPDASPLSANFIDGFTSIVASMKAWDSIFPITQLLQVVALIATFHIAMLLFKMVRWSIHLVRGHASS